MNLIQQILTIAIAAVTNFVTRWLPFCLFAGSEREVAPFIKGLGKFLPAAIMGMLVIYCYRNINFAGAGHGLPEIIAGLLTIALHVWRRSMFLSLIGGTVSYILLVNFVF